MSKTVVATFRSFPDAENAARQIKEQGLKTDDISIVARQSDTNSQTTGTTTASGVNDSTTATMASDRGTTGTTRNTGETNDNISDGVVTGGLLGGLAGLLIGAGSMVLPGLGAIAAAGPIAGLLSGAVTGGVVGGLVDLGIPEERGRQYEKELKEGRILFSMKTDDNNVQRVSSVLQSSGALSVDTY